MGRMTGKDGAFALPGNNAFIHLRQFTINYNTVDIDVSAFGDGAVKTAPGVKRWSFSARGSHDSTTPPAMPTTTISVTFTVGPGRTYVGACTLTELSPDVDFEGEAAISVRGVGDGDLIPA